MVRHLLRVFRNDLAGWIPAIVVVGLVTVLVGACMQQFVWTRGEAFVAAADAAGLDPAEFGSVSVTVYVLVAVLAIVALTVVGAATVERTRETFARWRLAGADPRQVRHGLWALVGVAAVAGALPGSVVSIGVGALAVPVFNRMAAQGFPGGVGDFTPPAFQPSVTAWAAAFVLGVVTCMCGAFGPSWRVARVDAVEAVRGTASARPGGAWWRRGAGGLLLGLAAVTMIGGIAAPQAKDVGVTAAGMVNSASTAGLIAALGVAVFGSELVPALLAVCRGLLRLVPTTLGPLAARSARARSEGNAHLIAPLAAAIGLGTMMLTVLRSYQKTMEAAGFPLPALNYADTFVLAGLFGFVALLTSVAVIALTGGDTAQEQALLRAAGMSPRQVACLTGWQSLLLAVCAGVLALVPLVFAGAIVAVRSVLIARVSILDVPWTGFAAATLACWAVLFLAQWVRLAPWLRYGAGAALRRG